MNTEACIERFGPDDFDALTDVWEASVRATHAFLPQGEVERLRPLVRNVYLGSADIYGVRGDDGRPAAFAGVCGDKLEMLFVHPSFFGHGLGRALVRYATDVPGVSRVDVNEQNTGAVAFYGRMGFATVSRDETDDQGMSYPVLHMELAVRRDVL